MKDLFTFLEHSEKLNKEAIAYGQQKNREHIYNQAIAESSELLGKRDENFVDARYEFLCKQSNITAW